MAKFCQNCGAPLNEGAKFCPTCGAGVGAPAPQPQPQQPQQPAYQQPQQPVYGQPQQPVYQQPVYQQPAQKPPKKKKGKGGLIVLIILLVAALGAVGYFGFRDGGWFRKAGRPTTYDGQNEFEAILNYADRLEAAGNAEAAAKVRARIPQAAAGEARDKAKRIMDENSDLKKFTDIEDALGTLISITGGKK